MNAGYTHGKYKFVSGNYIGCDLTPAFLSVTLYIPLYQLQTLQKGLLRVFVTTCFVNMHFQVRHPRCVLYDQYMGYKIIKLYSHTQLSIY
jgi:hypothetical protein